MGQQQAYADGFKRELICIRGWGKEVSQNGNMANFGL